MTKPEGYFHQYERKIYDPNFLQTTLSFYSNPEKEDLTIPVRPLANISK